MTPEARARWWRERAERAELALVLACEQRDWAIGAVARVRDELDAGIADLPAHLIERKLRAILDGGDQ